MTCTLHVAWDERLTDYHFGPGHPMAPVRVELTMRLAHEFGLWSQSGVTVAVPAPAADADLELVHDAPYVAAVEAVAAGLSTPMPARAWRGASSGSRGCSGWAPRITRSFPACTRRRRWWPGRLWPRPALSGPARPSMGQHRGRHASRDGPHASGFGVYNDPAVAIAWLLGHGAERIAYVDIDAHHGDGVQAAFYADPRVLTISVHEHPATLFPFTGLPAETGGPGAEGAAVNVALPAGTGDAGWLRAFHAIVPPLLRQFGPQVLVSQHGADTHRLDPLANLELSIDGQRAAHAVIHALAHEAAGGRWLSPAAGGMSWSRWYRGPGRTCSPRPQASRSIQARRPPPDGVSTLRGAPA